jgi:hypothetical protein
MEEATYWITFFVAIVIIIALIAVFSSNPALFNGSFF